MNKRILFYWHNGNGLGHISIVAKLAHAIYKRNNNVTIAGITGSSHGYELLPDNMDIVKIPSYLSFDRVEGFERKPVLSITENELFDIRSNLIKAFVDSFCPDILIVDMLPPGINDELLPAIISSPRTKKILTLRGVLWDKETTNSYFFEPNMVSFIDKYYDDIVVYTDANVFSLENYYNISEQIIRKFNYVGYLDSIATITKEQAKRQLNINLQNRLIVASLGGGQGAAPIWERIIKSLEKIENSYDQAILITGPYIENEDYRDLFSKYLNNQKIILKKFVSHLPIWMKAADIFIGAGGAGTLSEVIVTRANSIIIPRQYEESEQEIHSDLLAKHNVIRKVSLQQVLNNGISNDILDALRQPFSSHLQIKTNGAEAFANIIETKFNSCNYEK